MPRQKIRLENKREKLEKLRARIAASIAELERGEYDEFDDSELKSYLRRLATANAGHGRRARK